jgi:leucine-zipper-like transcriptional regulator 1
MVTFNDSLIVFGGDNGKTMINDLITYDCKNSSWGRALNNTPPSSRYHHSAVVYQSSMFVFGGYTIDSNTNFCNKNDLYEYKFSTGTWHIWQPDHGALPSPRSAHGAVVYDHKLWIFAGYGNVRLNDMWFIQLNAPSNKYWIEVNQNGDQPPTVCNFTIAVVGDSMYLFSGQSGARTSNHLYKFDFKTFSWSKVSSNYILRSTCSPPERRSGHIMVAYDQTLYIYGGGLGNIFFSDLHSFDLTTKTWNSITLSTVPSGRSFMAASVHGEYLYIFGGNGDQNTRSNELYRFKLPTQPKCTLKDDFYSLFKKQILCDLHFIIGNEIIKAHCAIVACRSTFFYKKIRKIYESSLRASNETSGFFLPDNGFIELRLDDVETSAVFQIILEFIYTDRLISLENKENETELVKLMIDVCRLAENFSMLKLVHICEVYISSIISTTNVLNLLEYVHSMDMKYLKECCMKFLIKDSNFNQIIMMQEFEKINQSLMVEIIRKRQSPQKSNSDRNDLPKFKSCKFKV